jgi:uncharacterized membrane protein YfhO
MNRVAFEVSAGKPAVVVLSDLLMRGWIATVDGSPQPIFHANYLFRGVLIGAGAHTIRMEYRPPEWRWAYVLAAVGWMAVAAAAFAGRRSRNA